MKLGRKEHIICAAWRAKFPLGRYGVKEPKNLKFWNVWLAILPVLQRLDDAYDFLFSYGQ